MMIQIYTREREGETVRVAINQCLDSGKAERKEKWWENAQAVRQRDVIAFAGNLQQSKSMDGTIYTGRERKEK